MRDFMPCAGCDEPEACEIVSRCLEPARPESCRWTHDEDSGIWNTACGEAHLFEEGGPAENEHRFCPYCGGALTTAGVALPPTEQRQVREDSQGLGVPGRLSPSNGVAPSQAPTTFCHECMLNVRKPCSYKDCPVGVPGTSTAEPSLGHSTPEVCNGCGAIESRGEAHNATCGVPAVDPAFRHAPNCGVRFATAGECTCGVTAAPASDLLQRALEALELSTPLPGHKQRWSHAINAIYAHKAGVQEGRDG